jgi:penicillin V acylase-like amidase (Ntn superfamily)
MSSSVVSRAQQVLLMSTAVLGCSNFHMENDYRLTGRTMDLGNGTFGLATRPRGSRIAFNNASASFGFVAFLPVVDGEVLANYATGGLNEAGLSCDEHALINTVYPNKTGTPSDLSVNFFCEYMLAQCATAEDARAVLANGTVTPHGPSTKWLTGGVHFALRDAFGESIVVEFLGGETVAAMDLNDGGETGFGVMTNEPPLQWHLENVRHAAWKQQNARPAFTIPGTFYPDERFLRLSLFKSAMPKPSSYQEAMMQAVHVLNSVTLPMGDQLGTDSSRGEGEGDHTLFGVVYDHANRTVYWRTSTNQNLQRLRLADARLHNASSPSSSSSPAFLPLDGNELPWFSDAASALFPTTNTHEEGRSTAATVTAHHPRARKQ